jgi:hypothetical protein
MIFLTCTIFFCVCCRDVDATTLACLAFSCPSLKTLEITMADNAINRMTGYAMLGCNLIHQICLGLFVMLVSFLN